MIPCRKKDNLLFRKEQNERSGFLKWIEFYLRCAALRQTSPMLDTLRIVYNIIVMILCGVSGWVMFYLKYDDLSLNTDVLMHAIVAGHTLYLYLVLLSHKKQIYKINDLIYNRFRDLHFEKLKVESYNEIWDKADMLSVNILRSVSYLGFSVYSMYVYNANLFSTERNLIYPMWVPYSLQSKFYYITIMLQLSLFALNFFIHVSCHGLGIGGAHFIGASFDVLGNIFKDICNNGNDYKEFPANNFNRADAKRRDAILKEQLKIIVQIHDSILSLIKDYKSVYEVIYVEVLLACQTVICFSGFQLVMAAEVKNIQRMVMLFCLIILLSFHLFLYCYQGQHIYDKSEQFRNSLYLCHWEDQSIAFQKSLSIMLVNTVKPVTISFKGVLHASMHSFLNAMKTAFSYINILLILREIY